MGSPKSEEEGVGFRDVLRQLDREETQIVVRIEMRRFGKPVTVVQGLDKTGRDLTDVTSQLKRRLATGGTTKDGLVLLQGDHRERVSEELVKLGFSQSNIEVL